MENKPSTLAVIRPFGRHTLEIPTNEKFSPFAKIRHLSSDSDPSDWTWLRPRKVELVRIATIRAGLPGLKIWSWIAHLEKYLEDVDFVDTAEVYTSVSSQCSDTTKKLGKPLVATVIETIPGHITSRIPPYSWNTKSVLKNTDLIVALTKRAKNYLLSIGSEEEKIRVIPQGIDLDRFHPPKDQNERQNVRILSVTSLIPRRGVMELLEAFRCLHRDMRHIELWLVGDGPLKGTAKTYSAVCPIRVLDWVPFRDLPQIYRQCHIFCLPGKDRFKFGIKIMEDGQFTISVLEAMASGLPLIVSNSGSYPEMAGTHNLIIHQGSVRQLYDALRLLVEDEQLRRRIGSSNRNRAEKMFEGRRQCEAYAEELTQLL